MPLGQLTAVGVELWVGVRVAEGVGVSLAVARGRQFVREGYAKRFLQMKEEKKKKAVKTSKPKAVKKTARKKK